MSYMLMFSIHEKGENKQTKTNKQTKKIERKKWGDKTNRPEWHYLRITCTVFFLVLLWAQLWVWFTFRQLQRLGPQLGKPHRKANDLEPPPLALSRARLPPSFPTSALGHSTYHPMWRVKWKKAPQISAVSAKRICTPMWKSLSAGLSSTSQNLWK